MPCRQCTSPTGCSMRCYALAARVLSPFPILATGAAVLHLVSRGRMPVSRFMPYNWYDTPNIHFCTVQDFEALVQDKGIRILARDVVGNTERRPLLAAPGPTCSRPPRSTTSPADMSALQLVTLLLALLWQRCQARRNNPRCSAPMNFTTAWSIPLSSNPR